MENLPVSATTVMAAARLLPDAAARKNSGRVWISGNNYNFVHHLTPNAFAGAFARLHYLEGSSPRVLPVRPSSAPALDPWAHPYCARTCFLRDEAHSPQRRSGDDVENADRPPA